MMCCGTFEIFDAGFFTKKNQLHSFSKAFFALINVNFLEKKQSLVFHFTSSETIPIFRGRVFISQSQKLPPRGHKNAIFLLRECMPIKKSLSDLLTAVVPFGPEW